MHLFIKIQRVPGIALVLAAMVLAGCGNKGDLYLDGIQGPQINIEPNPTIKDSSAEPSTIDDSLDELEVLEAEETEEANEGNTPDDDEDGDERDDDESKEKDAS